MKRTLTYSAVMAALILSQQAYAQDCSDLPIWQSDQAYNGGNQVQQNDSAYQAQWWTKGNSPAQFSGSWQEWGNLGVCDSQDGNIAPTISIISPLNNAQIVEAVTITLKANADDEDGNISKVEFFAGNQLLGQLTAAPYQLDWSATLGSSSIQVIATDNLGKSTSSQVSISVQSGDANMAPTISLTTPTAEDNIQPNDNVTLTANASDADGYVANVEFYVDNQLIASDNSEPFEAQWIATSGQHSLKAKAFDDKDAAATSNQVSLNVATTSSGGCGEVALYSAGTAYTVDQLVQLDNQKYRCDVAGWCSSDALWAYAPGTGQNWQGA